MVSQPTVISTFAGCGGSSLGYKLAGFKELLAVEWDDNAVETFKLNFPGIPVYHGDIAKLSSCECLKLAGIKKNELDVLDGSPPCQGFSTAGKRNFNDPRNSLFKEYARLLKELQPKVFVMENVTGMIKGVMKQAYLVIIKALRDCGYNVKGQVLNAMYFNVPQSRERIILIGVRNDLEIKPSHPKPQGKPITIKAAFSGIILDKNDLKETGLTPLYQKYWHSSKEGKSVGKLAKNKRLNWRKPSHTLQKSEGNGGAYHPTECRSLTIKEFKLIQSFPDYFHFVGNRHDAIERIGNSVPPNLMKVIAEHIKINILDKIA
jgi:DNA (cytosine-5)-methyltransferase 1